MKKMYKLQAASSGFDDKYAHLGVPCPESVSEQLRRLEDFTSEERRTLAIMGETQETRIEKNDDGSFSFVSPMGREAITPDSSFVAKAALKSVLEREIECFQKSRKMDKLKKDKADDAMFPTDEIEYKDSPDFDMCPDPDDDQGGGKIDEDDDFAMVPD